MMTVFVFVVVMMPVVLAPVRRAHQLAFQVSGYQGRHRRTRPARPHRDAMLRKQSQRPVANTARDDDLHAQFPQPSRKQAGLVLGRGHDFGTQGQLLFGVHFHQGELTAAAEVAVQAAVFIGNGDFHT